MRNVILGLSLLLLAACSTKEEDLTQPPEPLGQFRLGHNIAIADNVTKGPFSRDFTETQLETSVQNAVAKRLRRYDGDGLYHLGIVVGGIVLAQPGIPVVYAPQSVMILDVTVFDNRTQKKLNDKPERIFAGEGFRNAVPVIGSGYVRSAEAQLDNLSASAARAIENWLKKNPEWFAPREGQVRVPYDAQVNAPKIDTNSARDIKESAASN
ncbi:MAG: hypothetical protein OIF48_01680 [Silicimonas sp.]|nr:hypothetical protein [Silicimonas sp.]